jgi:hypothetical protein
MKDRNDIEIKVGDYVLCFASGIHQSPDIGCVARLLEGRSVILTANIRVPDPGGHHGPYAGAGSIQWSKEYVEVIPFQFKWRYVRHGSDQFSEEA